MPRPGPRPYECVRRAWHSDRHKPIRGSLIQEIFRVVNGIHSSATKKNKEWQEKLPIVVLKAEEIMYSKANSETEYMDLKTLWDRANEAIDTIIRRDESTETGELLLPCIEAALHLGCTPRRSSRSQRNSNPGCYLSASVPETTSAPPCNLDNTTQGNQQLKSFNSNFTVPSYMNSTHLGLDSSFPITQNNNCTTNKSQFLSEKLLPHGTNQCLPMGTYPSSNSCLVYPLYYGNHLQSQELQSHFGITAKSNSHTPDSAETETGAVQNLLLSCNVDASNKIPQTEFRDALENSHNIGCDLSLRLGPLSIPSATVENSLHQEVEDVGSSTHREGRKLSDLSPPMEKEFSFYRKANADDSTDFCLNKWSSECENMNVDATMRKRKAVVSPPSEGRQFCWQRTVSSNLLTGRMSSAGL
ncbi:uncharacterized protein LOC132304483 [Cornus florida]|uniref:uncharacterized protein LOC132304483 n=1 Tax=Cornus florida TaxID=4283 RepID=UPI00289AD913|nr:uncharacterized protein LOC132304483 [Cornus florida]